MLRETGEMRLAGDHVAGKHEAGPRIEDRAAIDRIAGGIGAKLHRGIEQAR